MIEDYYKAVISWRNYVLGSDRWLQTILLGGFFLSLQTILTHIFVAGILLRFLFEETECQIFEFDDWWNLFKYGIYVYTIWISYFIIPIISWIVWIQYYYFETDELTVPNYAQELANTTTELIGIGLGMPWGAVHDLVRITQDLGVHVGFFDLLDVSQNPSFKSQILFILFIISFILALYMFPAALQHYNRTDALRSIFNIPAIIAYSVRIRYFLTWCVLIAIWLCILLIQHSWNHWRASIPTPDSNLFTLGIVPFIEIPTTVGIISTGFLLTISMISFVLLSISFHIFREMIIER